MTRLSDERAIWIAREVMPHEAALRHWLRRKPLGGLEIDDVVQETYARLIQTASIDGIVNVRAYMFQAAQSVLLTHYRRSKVVAFQTMADLDDLGARDEQPSPERQVSDRDELRQLAVAIASLPSRIGAVFRLRKIDGLTQKEVALRLGIAESTIEKHMSRALQLMAAQMSDGGSRPANASMVVETKVSRGHGPTDRSGD